MSPARPAHQLSKPVEQSLRRVAAELGATIGAERARRSWTMAELARRAGVSISRVSEVEAGAIASAETYIRLAHALGLRPDLVLADPRRRSSNPARDEDPVHAAMGEIEATRFGTFGFRFGIDEPFQHYQFAGRADLVAWSSERSALLHCENRTRFPNVQEALGSYNTKRAYLADEIAQRQGVVGGYRSVCHVIVALWSSEVLHTLKMRRETFRAACPDPMEGFEGWWRGEPAAAGNTSTLVLFDPLAGNRSTKKRWVGLDQLTSVRPRYTGYAHALDKLRLAGKA